MLLHHKKKIFTALLICFSVLTILACRLTGMSNPTTPSPITGTPSGPSPTLVSVPTPNILLQRLRVSFLGPDGNKLVGSGCPGSDGKGFTVDYHFSVSGVDRYRQVTRVMVAGDHSTLTWAMPCAGNWELVALDAGDGNWDIFIAPSESSHIYTVLFFYSDNAVALGMTTAP